MSHIKVIYYSMSQASIGWIKEIYSAFKWQFAEWWTHGHTLTHSGIHTAVGIPFQHMSPRSLTVRIKYQSATTR